MDFAFPLINAVLLDEIEEAEEIYNLNINRRILRDTTNPFTIPNSYFKKMYRFEKNMMIDIIDMISPFLQDSQYSNAIPKYLKILAAISFFASGSYQKCIGQDFNFGMSQTMISRAIKEVSDVMVTHLLNDHIKFPEGPEVDRTKRGFFEKFNVGGIIGLIDGTHVAIIAPSTEDENHPPIIYYNRKGFYSINVQLICDSDLNIVSANARFPGSCHDSAIWASSAIRRHLLQNYEQGNHNIWLLGDSGYPLEPWLLTPILNPQPNTAEARYTNHHCHIRNAIERCNGVLKMRFRCLTKARTLNYHPVRAGKIIYSCIILHNLARRFRLEDDYDDDYEADNEENDVNEVNLVGENLGVNARRIRANFIRNYFN